MSSPNIAKYRRALPVDSPLRRRLPPLLRRAWFSLNQAFRRRLAPLGLTPDQFTVMRTLLENEARGLTQQDLARLISSDANTITSLLRRMERARLIQRTRHERDARAKRVRLRPVGREKYEQARFVALSLQSEVLAALPAGQREGFLAALNAVADSCQAAAGRAPRRTPRQR